jgi:hypothetical protein
MIAPAAPATKPATAAPDIAKVSEAEFRAQMNQPFTFDQMRGIAADEVGSGRLTREQADAALTADGVDNAAPNLLDGFEPARVGQYETPRPVSGFDPEGQSRDTKLRGWLAGMKFPQGHGSHLVHEITRAGAQFKDMTEPARKLWARSETIRLENLWGAQAQEKIKLAQQLVREIEAKQPGFVELLEESGAGNSADVIVAMHAQAFRLAARSTKAQG